MSKYYVAGIPFDSEDSLKHDGVKGMKWGQHIFGPDANTKYINWMKNVGQNIGKFTTNTANTIGKAATEAARAVGGTLNKSANFVTGNQARENLNAANANVANVQSGRSKVNDAYSRYDQLKKSEAQHRRTADGWRDSLSKRAPLENFGRNQDRINADNEDRRANRDANRAEIAKMKADRMAERQRNAETQARAEAKNAQQAYDRTLPGAAENAARGAQGFLNSAGKWVSTAAGNAAKGVSDAANQAGQWVGDRAKDVGNFVSNKDEEQRMRELAKNYDPNTGKWRSESDRQAFYEAQNAYNNHPLTAVPNIARQIGTDISDGPVGDFARGIGNMANQIGSDVSNYVDYNITGAGQNRDADMYEDWIRQNREKRGAGQPAYQVDREAELSKAANEAREDAQNNTLFGRIGNAANSVGNWFGDRAKDVGNMATDAWNGVTDAANQAGDWIGDRAREAGETIGNATKDAREWAGNAANEVGKAAGSAVNAVGNVANDAGQWIGDRAKEAGETIGNAAESVQDWATNAVDDITGKNRARENHSNQMRDYASEVIDPGYSSRDREKILRDMISAEDDAISKGVADDRFFGGNVGGAIRNNLDMIDYIMNQIPNTPSSGQEKLYEYIEDLRNQNQMYLEAILGSKYPDGVRIRHSDISDKPEGVGEAFWKNYIAHGGTREDYEREWR